MSKESIVHCLLGNGICPEECPHHEVAAKVSEKLGDSFEPFLSRLAIVFGDGFIKDINVTHVAAAMARCALEKPLKEG
ncbi:hypothetical protein HYU45_03890 [Candidatus Daviesbacteria bacterium]|nr:hypothetical protein [Candidatus Daviesbacteria bacterium]